MEAMEQQQLERLLDRIGLDEPPMGLFYTDQVPESGYSPALAPLPTRELELQNAIDWPNVFADFSCFMGGIWRARKKHTAAFIGHDRFGCPGAAFWLGFIKPQTETIINYVSTGIPHYVEGEYYCDSPDNLRELFNFIDPRPAPKPYCVVKPVDLFTEKETPELIIFFARPESLSGLHQLTTYVTNDPEIVASPWTAACGGIGAWPIRYLTQGLNKAVVSGWDPSARKFFKTDELSFTVPLGIFREMLKRFDESFLKTKTWDIVRKKIERSRSMWGENRGAKAAE